jgi:hypothetical protein
MHRPLAIGPAGTSSLPGSPRAMQRGVRSNVSAWRRWLERGSRFARWPSGWTAAQRPSGTGSMNGTSECDELGETAWRQDELPEPPGMSTPSYGVQFTDRQCLGSMTMGATAASPAAWRPLPNAGEQSRKCSSPRPVEGALPAAIRLVSKPSTSTTETPPRRASASPTRALAARFRLRDQRLPNAPSSAATATPRLRQAYERYRSTPEPGDHPG